MDKRLKLLILGLTTLALRFIPGRLPNLEGVMTTTMPLGKKYGAITGAGFAVASMLAYDLLSGRIGIWSWWTALVYGLIGMWAGLVWSQKIPTRLDYVKFALVGTLVFDGLTGLTIGPLFWGQSFMQALIGQIPFTLYHLIGNLTLAAVVSPLLYTFLNQELLASTVAPQASTQSFPRP